MARFRQPQGNAGGAGFTRPGDPDAIYNNNNNNNGMPGNDMYLDG